MSISISKIIKKGKFNVGEFVVQYLDVLPEILKKEGRAEDFVFVNGIGSLGMVFEGKALQKKQLDYASNTINIAGKNFAIVKYLIKNNEKEIEKLKIRINKEMSYDSRFIFLEHTGRWKEYEGEYWLANCAPPYLTFKNNIYVPQGPISIYFGYDENKLGFYKKERRGREFAKKMKGKSYNEIRNCYFSKFIDNNNIVGLVSKKETGLIHFTTGIYESKSYPVIYWAKSEAAVSEKIFVEGKDFYLTFSLRSAARAFQKQICKNAKLESFPSGKLLQQRIY